MDLSKLSDVELTEHWLALSRDYPSTCNAMRAVDVDARARGPERMAAARLTVGTEREAARQVAQ
jgi:hypothetical protein